jgi:hypothetical protein
MGRIADMLARGGNSAGHADHMEPPEGDGGDPKAMAAAAVKAMFEAAKAGDFETAAEHLSSAMEHCEKYDGEDGEGPASDGGHAALLLVPHKG